MKIRRRVAALVVAALSVTGLALVAETVKAPPAQAATATGIHTLYYECHNGSHNSTTSFTYDMTFTGTSNDGHTNNYTFQMLSSHYTGTTPSAGRGPTLAITFSGKKANGGDLWLSSGFGGSQGITNYVWPRNTALNGATLTDGINVDWGALELTVTPEYEGNLWANYYQYSQGPCSVFTDLGFPDEPQTGALSRTMNCDASNGTLSDPDWEDHLTFDYNLTRIGGNHFSLQVTEAEWINGDGSGVFGPDLPSEIALVLKGARNQTGLILDSGTPNWTRMGSVTNDSFHEVDGLFGVSFPTIEFDYMPGDNPIIAGQFTRTYLGFPEATHDVTCEAELPLAKLFSGNIDSDPQYEDITFDDCSSNPTQVSIKPIWERTSDNFTYRLKALSVYQLNSSGSKIVLDAGTSSTPGGITLSNQTGILPNNLVTLSSNVSLANRTILNNTTKVFAVNDPGSWTRMNLPYPESTAMSSIYIEDDEHPKLTIRAKVYSSTGVECVPSVPGGSGDISELDYAPNP
jgi:hypothetical protein